MPPDKTQKLSAWERRKQYWKNVSLKATPGAEGASTGPKTGTTAPNATVPSTSGVPVRPSVRPKEFKSGPTNASTATSDSAKPFRKPVAPTARPPVVPKGAARPPDAIANKRHTGILPRKHKLSVSEDLPSKRQKTLAPPANRRATVAGGTNIGARYRETDVRANAMLPPVGVSAPQQASVQRRKKNYHNVPSRVQTGLKRRPSEMPARQLPVILVTNANLDSNSGLQNETTSGPALQRQGTFELPATRAPESSKTNPVTPRSIRRLSYTVTPKPSEQNVAKGLNVAGGSEGVVASESDVKEVALDTVPAEVKADVGLTNKGEKNKDGNSKNGTKGGKNRSFSKRNKGPDSNGTPKVRSGGKRSTESNLESDTEKNVRSSKRFRKEAPEDSTKMKTVENADSGILDDKEKQKKRREKRDATTDETVQSGVAKKGGSVKKGRKRATKNSTETVGSLEPQTVEDNDAAQNPDNLETTENITDYVEAVNGGDDSRPAESVRSSKRRPRGVGSGTGQPEASVTPKSTRKGSSSEDVLKPSDSRGNVLSADKKGPSQTAEEKRAGPATPGPAASAKKPKSALKRLGHSTVVSTPRSVGKKGNQENVHPREGVQTTAKRLKSVSFHVPVDSPGVSVVLPKTPRKELSLRQKLEDFLDAKGYSVSRHRHLRCFGEQLSEARRKRGPVQQRRGTPRPAHSSSPALRDRQSPGSPSGLTVGTNETAEGKICAILNDLKELLLMGQPVQEATEWVKELEEHAAGILKQFPSYWVVKALMDEQEGRYQQALAVLRQAVENNVKPTEELSQALSDFMKRIETYVSAQGEAAPSGFLTDVTKDETAGRKSSSRKSRARRRLEDVSPLDSTLVKYTMQASTSIPNLDKLVSGFSTPRILAVLTPVRRSARLAHSTGPKTRRSLSLTDLPKDLQNRVASVPGEL